MQVNIKSWNKKAQSTSKRAKETDLIHQVAQLRASDPYGTALSSLRNYQSVLLEDEKVRQARQWGHANSRRSDRANGVIEERRHDRFIPTKISAKRQGKEHGGQQRSHAALQNTLVHDLVSKLDPEQLEKLKSEFFQTNANGGLGRHAFVQAILRLLHQDQNSAVAEAAAAFLGRKSRDHNDVGDGADEDSEGDVAEKHEAGTDEEEDDAEFGEASDSKQSNSAILGTAIYTTQRVKLRKLATDWRRKATLATGRPDAGTGDVALPGPIKVACCASDLFCEIDAERRGMVSWDQFTSHVIDSVYIGQADQQTCLLREYHFVSAAAVSHYDVTERLRVLRDFNLDDSKAGGSVLLMEKGRGVFKIVGISELAATSRINHRQTEEPVTLPQSSAETFKTGDAAASTSGNDALNRAGSAQFNSQKPCREVTGHHGEVLACKHLASLNYIVTSATDRTICFWDTISLKLRQRLPCAEIVVALEWLQHTAKRPKGHHGNNTNQSKGSVLFAATMTGEIYAYDPSTLQVIMHVPNAAQATVPNATATHHTDACLDLALIATTTKTDKAQRGEAGLLASAGLDAKICLWDPITGQHKRTLRGHAKGIFLLSFAHQHRMLISAGYDHDVLVWDPHCETCICRLAGHTSPLVGVHLAHHSPQLISASCDGIIKVWDLRNFRCFQTIHCAGALRAESSAIPVKISEIGFFDTANHSCILVASGPRVFVYETDYPTDPDIADNETTQDVLFHSPTGTFATSSGRSVRVWDTTTGRILHEHQIPPLERQMRSDSSVMAGTRTEEYDGGSLAPEETATMTHNADSVDHMNSMSSLGTYSTVHEPSTYDYSPTAAETNTNNECKQPTVTVFCFDSNLTLLIFGDDSGRVASILYSSGALVHLICQHTASVTALQCIERQDLLVSTDLNSRVMIHQMVGGDGKPTFVSEINYAQAVQALRSQPCQQAEDMSHLSLRRTRGMPSGSGSLDDDSCSSTGSVESESDSDDEMEDIFVNRQRPRGARRRASSVALPLRRFAERNRSTVSVRSRASLISSEKMGAVRSIGVQQQRNQRSQRRTMLRRLRADGGAAGGGDSVVTAAETMSTLGFGSVHSVTDEPHDDTVISPLPAPLLQVELMVYEPLLGLLATCANDASITIWDMKQLRKMLPIGVLEGHKYAVSSLAFLAPFPALVSADTDGCLCIWSVPPSDRPFERRARFSYLPEVSEDAKQATGMHPHADPVLSLAWDPTTCSLFTGGVDGDVTCWELAESLESLKLSKLPDAATMPSLSFPRHGSSTATTASKEDDKQWKFMTGGGEAHSTVLPTRERAWQAHGVDAGVHRMRIVSSRTLYVDLPGNNQWPNLVLITCALDKTVKLWTHEGQMVGMLHQCSGHVWDSTQPPPADWFVQLSRGAERKESELSVAEQLVRGMSLANGLDDPDAWFRFNTATKSILTRGRNALVPHWDAAAVARQGQGTIDHHGRERWHVQRSREESESSMGRTPHRPDKPPTGSSPRRVIARAAAPVLPVDEAPGEKKLTAKERLRGVVNRVQLKSSQTTKKKFVGSIVALRAAARTTVAVDKWKKTRGRRSDDVLEVTSEDVVYSDTESDEEG